jgi:hypothetical protein
MFGLPPPNTVERIAFFASFWPSLWSGILSSIVTGIIVGLILIYWQRSLENRLARRGYARELSILKEKVREAISIPDSSNINSAIASIPSQAEGLKNLLREVPISLWHEELPNEKPFLNLAHGFQQAYSEFKINALEFDKLLSQFARDFNGAQGRIQVNDGFIISYVLGRLQGVVPEELAKWIDGGLVKIPTWVEEAYVSAAKEEMILLIHKKYSASRIELVKKIEHLAKNINA